MKLTETRQYQLYSRAMELALPSGKTVMSKSGKSVFFAPTDSHPEKVALESQSRFSQLQIEEWGLEVEVEQARAQLEPEWAAQDAAADKKAVVGAKRAAVVAASDALLDRAFADASLGYYSSQLHAEISAAKLNAAQKGRYAGIVEFAKRRAAEVAEQDRESARAAQQAAYQAQQAQWAAQRAARQAQLDATRVRMALDEVPAIGETFWISEDNTTIRVCTGYSKQPWQLSQNQIDDNDDFHLEGVWLTYVYFEERTISMHDALELRLARRDAQREIEEREQAEQSAAREKAARFEALKAQAMAGNCESTNSEPDLSAYETLFNLHRNDPQSYGHYIGQSETELIYIQNRPLVGDWMDCQTLYTVYRAPLAR